MADRLKTCPERKPRHPELFEILRAYLLYCTGRPLTALVIAEELRRLSPNPDFKPSAETIRRYLAWMKGEDEIFELEREYVKPHFINDVGTQTGHTLDSGKFYYLNIDKLDLKEIARSNNFGVIKHGSISYKAPSVDVLEKKTIVFGQLKHRYTSVKGGAIVYHFKNESGKDQKITVAADFFVDGDEGNRLYVFSSQKKNMFSRQKRNRLSGSDRDITPALVRDAVLSVCRFVKIPITVVLLWDKEPQDGAYFEDKKMLESKGCSFVRWNVI